MITRKKFNNKMKLKFFGLRILIFSNFKITIWHKLPYALNLIGLYLIYFKIKMKV
jgi:hypothetical protein